MGFAGEEDHAAGDAQHLGGIKSGHALGIGDAVVVLPLHEHDGRVPVLHVLVRRGGIGMHGRLVIPVPGSTPCFPVLEEHLLGGIVHHLLAENAAVGYECLETLLMVSRQPVHGESPETGTHCTKPVPVHVRLGCNIIGSGQQVLHGQSAVVPAYLVGPELTVTAHPATGGSDNHVAVGGHLAHVPAVAPELPEYSLGSARAEHHGRVFLVFIKVRRVNGPDQHLFVIHRGNPALPDFRHGQLVQQVLVLEAQFGGLTRGRIHTVDLLGFGHVHPCGDKPVAGEGHAVIIVHTGSNRCYPGGLHVHFVNIVFRVHRTDKIEVFPLVHPYLPEGRVIEIRGEVALLSAGQFHLKKPLLIGLVSGPFHAVPVDPAAIGRKERNAVVARHAQGQVLCLSALQVVQVDIRIGTEGVLQPGHLLAGVGDPPAVGCPGHLFQSPEGLHGRIVRFPGHQVGSG